MKLLNRIFSKKVEVKNEGHNSGIEVGENSGKIIVNQGLGYTETKALCCDIVKEELGKYKEDALIEAKKRDTELFELFVKKLDENNMSDEKTLAEFKNPSMQYDYLEAQKAYIKSGTPELAAILSDILIARVNEPSRTVLQIALGESISVAQKLVKSQLALLALTFTLKYTRKLGIRNLQQFREYLLDVPIKLFNDGVNEKDSEFQHLEYCGCGQISVLKGDIITSIKDTYTGLFMRGFTIDSIPSAENGKSLYELYPMLFMRCFNDKDKLQLGAIDKESLEKRMNLLRVEDKHKTIIIQLFENNAMDKASVTKVLEDLVPEMNPLIDYWEKSRISNLTLTSVGIIIGARYAKLITNQEYDLKIWI